MIITITIVTCWQGLAYAQNNDLDGAVLSDESTSSPEALLLEEAYEKRYNDSDVSASLANEALNAATKSSNAIVSARATLLIARLTQEAGETDYALTQFSQASNMFEKAGDVRYQLLSSIEYVNVLIENKQHDEGHAILDRLLEVAQIHGDEWPIAIIHNTKADSVYEQKRYQDAIVEYRHAVRYLSGEDHLIKRELGNTYKNIAQSYKRLKDRQKTADFYKNALAIYTELDDKKLMARTLNTLADSERYLGNFVQALDYSNQGLELHKNLDDPDGEAKALNGSGIIYRHIGRYERSLQAIHKAHLYYQKVKNVSGIAKTSNQMGLLYTRLKQFDQARSFYQLTVDLPSTEIPPDTLATALRELAVIDLNFEEYETAMKMAQQAYSIYLSEKNMDKSSLTARVIANIYRGLNKPAKSIEYYKKSLALAQEVGSVIYQIKAQTALAGELIDVDNEQAITLLKSSLSLSEDIGNKSESFYAVRSLLEAEKSRGNVSEALRYAELQIALASYLQSEKETKQISLAKASLHSHKIEVELTSLKEKNRLDQLQLIKKTNEIEIAHQTQVISKLELTKNKYATLALISLLIICLLAILLVYRRFIDSKRRNRELDYLAARDPLTNCYNRRRLFELLNRDFENVETLDEFCIIMADVDHFKNVNDTFGHNQGDSVLVGVADILQASVRQNDYVSRFGGEEFCIVLPGATEEIAMRISEAIRNKIEKTVFGEVNITCSFGVASIHCEVKTPAELIEKADVSLYRSKLEGRNQVTLFVNKPNVEE